MIVYVESNFVLELAYLQEQHDSCQGVLELAEAGSIQLVLPAFSISEPYDSYVRRSNGRKAMLTSFNTQVRELARSAPYAGISEQSTATTALIARSLDEEKARLDEVLRRILRCAEAVPVTAEVLDMAISLQKGAIDSPQDAFVFASVATHLRENAPKQSCFMNRNAGDFSDPLVKAALDTHGCKLFGRFDEGLRFLRSEIKK